MSRADDYNTQGQWAVFANFGGHLSMHAVGDESIEARNDEDMLTARKLLDRRSRSVLLPLLKEAIATGEHASGVVDHQGRRYRAEVRPILTPDRTIVIGAIAAYDYNERVLPIVPLIGAWQWAVRMDNTNYGEDASVWDENLHRIHEYQPSAVTNSRGPAGEWLSKLVPASEQFFVNDFVKRGLDACNNRPLVLNMGAIIRPDSANPGRKQLELIGTAMPHPSHPDAKFAYGFTREVPRSTRSRAIGYETVSTAEFVRAYFEAAGKLAMASIDLQVGSTFQRSPGWTALGLHPEFDGDFTSLAPVAARSELLSYFERSRRAASSDPDGHNTVLRIIGGKELAVRITAARIDRDVDESRYLLLTLERA